MRKPIIFKDHCDDELPWACCYGDEESNIEWSEGRFYIGWGKTAVEAYEDWNNKKGLEELKKWASSELSYDLLQQDMDQVLNSFRSPEKLPNEYLEVINDHLWELVLK